MGKIPKNAAIITAINTAIKELGQFEPAPIESEFDAEFQADIFLFKEALNNLKKTLEKELIAPEQIHANLTTLQHVLDNLNKPWDLKDFIQQHFIQQKNQELKAPNLISLLSSYGIQLDKMDGSLRSEDFKNFSETASKVSRAIDLDNPIPQQDNK